MSRTFGTLCENAARKPSRLDLRVPLAAAWSAPTLARMSRDRDPPALVFEDLVFVTAPDSRVVGLDLHTGRERWRYPLPGLAVGLDQGRLLVRLSDELHVVRAVDGVPEGAALCHGEGPVVASGGLLVGVSRLDEHDGHLLHVMDWRSGKRLWSQRIRPGNGKVQGYLSARGAVLAIPTADGSDRPSFGLEVRDHVSGTLRWRQATAGSLMGLLTLTDDLIVGPFGMTLTAYHVTDGAPAWECRGVYSACIYEDLWYCLLFDKGHYLMTLDAASGRKVSRWSLASRVAAARRWPTFLLAVTETHILTGDEDPGALIVALRRENAKHAWSHVPPGSSSVRLRDNIAWVDGHLFVHDHNHVHCLRERCSTPSWNDGSQANQLSSHLPGLDRVPGRSVRTAVRQQAAS